MAVSQEELLMHDCQVVCPQCLAVCRYENGTLVVRDDSDAPYRHTAAVDPSKHDTESRFCYNCGKQLPAGISFCPYCGSDLGSPFAKKENTVEEAAPAPQQPVREPQPVKEKAVPEVKKQSVTQSTAAPNQVEEKLRTMSRHYTSVHPQLHQNGTMPGTAFKVFAYAIIVILLVLLVVIIIAGNSLE